jgi:hypothetical protein
METSGDSPARRRNALPSQERSRRRLFPRHRRHRHRRNDRRLGWPHRRKSLRPHRPYSNRRNVGDLSPSLPQSKPNHVRLLLRPNQRNHRRRRQQQGRALKSPSLPRTSGVTGKKIAMSRSAKKKIASNSSKTSVRRCGRAGHAQMAPQRPAGSLVGVDVAVDGFVGHASLTL